MPRSLFTHFQSYTKAARDEAQNIEKKLEKSVSIVPFDHGPKKDQIEDDSRPQWSSSTEFLMSCISMSVGLGNVWRFPFTAYENGGGAFLIPYLIVLMFIGRPLYLLELGLGQFCSGGCIKVWDLSPVFRGVGYGQVLATCCVVSYYCSLIGLAIYYLVASCQTTLPWTVCHPQLHQNGTFCFPSNGNKSDLPSNGSNLTVIASSEQYFKAGVLKEHSDISDGIGLPDPALAACLVACWFFLFMTLYRGVSGSGKFAYFTAIFPYVVMFILLVRGLTLPGASEGLLFFFTPQWSRLLDPAVWYAAVTQSFFSLGVGFGALTTYSSYNKFHHNSYKDALIISFADTFTSILAGTVIFAILGHLSYELGLPVKDVVKSGAGLAFVSYPEVISKFDFAPQVFAVLFFLMLITLGFGSAIGLISNVITVLCDAFPSFKRSYVTAVVSIAGLLVGLVYVTPGGQPLLELVDYYGGGLLVLTLALVEIIAIAWIYGVGNVIKDLNMMLKTELGYYWKICWTIIIPVSLSLILSYAIYDYKPVSYDSITLPVSAQAAGWIMTGLGVAMVPIFMIVRVCQNRNVSGSVFSSSSSWGPKVTEDWSNWMRSKDEVPRWVELPEVQKAKLEESYEGEEESICLEFNQDIHEYSLSDKGQKVSSKMLPSTKSECVLEHSDTFYTCEGRSFNSCRVTSSKLEL